jgi:cytoskeletal protein RodZ
VTANCFDDCSLTPTSGGSSRNKKKNALWWLTDLRIILPVCAGLLLILVGVLYKKRQTSQKDSEEAKHDEGVAERRLRFDEEDLVVEERKEAPSSDDEDVEAPPTPSPAPPLPPRSRDHTTPRRRVEEVLDDPRSPRPNRSPVPMTWGDVDKAAARSPAPPTPVLYLGDEDDADDGSAFGDDDVVPPPPPPLPSELSTGRPEPSVPRPPRTEEYFGANVYDRSPRPDEPGGRLFI